jgi:hypothetical protein
MSAIAMASPWAAKRDATYHEERVAPRRPRHTERPPLGPLELARGAGHAPEHEGDQFRGHGGCTADCGDGVCGICRCQRWSSSEILGIDAAKPPTNQGGPESHLPKRALAFSPKQTLRC